MAGKDFLQFGANRLSRKGGYRFQRSRERGAVGSRLRVRQVTIVRCCLRPHYGHSLSEGPICRWNRCGVCRPAFRGATLRNRNVLVADRSHSQNQVNVLGGTSNIAMTQCRARSGPAPIRVSGSTELITPHRRESRLTQWFKQPPPAHSRPWHNVAAGDRRVSDLRLPPVGRVQ